MKNKSRYALTGVLLLYGALTTASTLLGVWCAAGRIGMLLGGLLLLWAAAKLLPSGNPKYGPALLIGGVVLTEAAAVTNELVLIGELSLVSQSLRILLSILLVVWYFQERKKD